MLLSLDQELSVIYSQRTPAPPPKPLNISKNAVWHGGLDGGSWYDCHKTKVAYEVHCTVYGEGGNVWVKDDFEMYATQMYELYKKLPLKDFINQEIDRDYPMFFNGIDINMKYVITLEPKHYSADDKSQFE